MSPKRHIFTLMTGAFVLFNPLSLMAAGDAKECSKEMLMSYFPEEYVKQTLDKFSIPQAQRAGIINELSEKDHLVISTVEERAAKMDPNPLRDPQHRKTAVKLFRDTLYDLFSQVMQAHGVNDKEKIAQMLDYMQQQKAKAFASCMDKMKIEDVGAPTKITPKTNAPQGAPKVNESAPQKNK